MRKPVSFILNTTTLYATIPLLILRNSGDIKSTIKQNKYVKIHPCLKQRACKWSVYTTLKNTGSKLKPDQLICCGYVFI